MIVLFLFLIFFIGLIISIKNITSWKKESDETEKQIERIKGIVEPIEIEDNEITEVVEPAEEINDTNPYWDYIKMNLINVDFTELKKVNTSTVGWIQVNGTNINYPFVQTTDNKYYLKHSFDKSYNGAWWVFLDYRNNVNNFDKNTILYAHGRIDKTMFGTLKNILTSDWLKKEENFVVKLSTETENTLWQVFSVYIIPTTNDYIQTEFSSEEYFQDWTNMLIERSSHNFNSTVSSKDKVLTLSTCYNENEKIVLHAKLIKSTKR